MPVIVAKKYPKVQVTVRLHPLNLGVLEKIGDRKWRNRSEMIDLAIEEFVRNHAHELEDGGGGGESDGGAPTRPGAGQQGPQGFRRGGPGGSGHNRA